jgi:hypothetical protein
VPLHETHERAVADRRDALAGVPDVNLLTTLAICCATWRARGSRSDRRKISSHARCATASSSAISRTLRQSSVCGKNLMKRDK